MRAICLYLHIHQPIRYRKYSVFDIGNNDDYWHDDFSSKQNNERIFKKVAEKSYRPTLAAIEKNLAKHEGFRISFSITGTWLEQAEKWCPDLIDSLNRIVATGRAEIVGETYYHSLAFFYNREEFEAQVLLHEQKIIDIFGIKPTAFRNTELSYNDDLAEWADKKGYEAILAEGWDRILEWRSPNYVYTPKNCKKLRLLMKNYRLSDDIAFRFSDRHWKEWPLTVDKYITWINDSCLNGNLINLFMDFETFGEHQWKDTGIFDFMDSFIESWLQIRDNCFVTITEAANLMKPVGEISMPETVTWADTERDLSAWLGNDMQKSAMRELYSLRDTIYATHNTKLINDFRRFTTSDHPYYMCTKYWNDGDVHAYFSAYDSPYEAFMYFENCLRDLSYRAELLQNRRLPQ